MRKSRKGNNLGALMLFWVICAVMTGAVLYALMRPLSGVGAGSAAPFSEASRDLAVYRDQLDEVDADRARGLLADAEAKAARLEISRRLLARAGLADAVETPRQPRPASGAARAALVSATVGVPLIALTLYLIQGSPTVPGHPYAQRMTFPAEDATIADLVARVEARLQAHPEDGQGWDVIAPVYMRQGRFMEAAQAYQRALRLLGENPRRLAGYGEAAILAGNGIVTEEARRAFERLKQIEPQSPLPRFWLALAKEQDGQLEAALADYRKLMVEAPADAPWRSSVQERVDALSRAVKGGAEPSPPAAEETGGERLSDVERATMINQMVAGLAERLQVNSRDLAGWQRLLRAYSTLGQKDKAMAALAEARKAFAGDGASLATLDELARSLGLES